MKLLVKKRTGELQPFNLVKIMRTLKAAGAGAALVQEVAWDAMSEILSDVGRGAGAAVISSQEIKKIVVKNLSKEKPPLAKKYAEYEK